MRPGLALPVGGGASDRPTSCPLSEGASSCATMGSVAGYLTSGRASTRTACLITAPPQTHWHSGPLWRSESDGVESPSEDSVAWWQWQHAGRVDAAPLAPASTPTRHTKGHARIVVDSRMLRMPRSI